jgi:aspartate/tyrosine/aromatic aminotransferase
MVRHGVLNNVTKLSNSRFSQWSKSPLAPPDKILGLNEMFNQDNHSLKVNLGVGAYRNENRNPLIFNCFFDCFDTFEEIWGEF